LEWAREAVSTGDADGGKPAGEVKARDGGKAGPSAATS